MVTFVSERTGYNITLDEVQISWLDKATFSNVLLSDQSAKTMIEAGEVMIDFTLSELFVNGTLNVDDIVFSSGELALIKYPSDSLFNLQRFIRALVGDKKSTKKSSKVTITSLELESFFFSHHNLNDTVDRQ